MPRMKKPRASVPPVHLPARAASASAKRSAAPSAASANVVSSAGDALQVGSRRRGRRGRASAPRPAWRSAAPPSPPARAGHSAAASSPAIRFDARLRRVGEDRREPRDILDGEVEQEGAVAERVAEESRDRRIGRARRRASLRAAAAPAASRKPLERGGGSAANRAAPRCAARSGSGGTADAATPARSGWRRGPGLLSVSTSVAAMQLRDRRDEAQAKAGAGLRAAFLQPHEALGHARAVRLRDAGAVVGDARTSPRPRSSLTEIATSGFALPSSAYLMALSTRLASAWLISSRLRVHHHRPARLRACSATPASSASGS